MASCLMRMARSGGDVFTNASSGDMIISALNGTTSGAILAGFAPTGGVAGPSMLRLDPTAGLIVNGNISVVGQILQGGSNVVTGGGSASSAPAAPAAPLNTSNLVCSTLTVTDTLTLGANSVSFAHGSGAAITASTWNYMQNYVYSGTTVVPPLARTLFTGVAQNHSAYIENGAVFAFGDNDHGQLGLGDLVNRSLPTAIPGVTGAVAVACGQGYTVILLASGSALAMGNNAYGQLGDGTIVDRHVPTAVSGVAGATTVVTGYNHTLFLLSNGAVVGYGSSSVGQLGAGTNTVVNTTLVTTTVPVASGSTAPASFVCRAIDAGAYHSVLLLANGTAYTFGQNAYGQLGLGNTAQQVVPTLVSQASATKVVGVGAGQFHTLLVLYDGTVMSCGRNDSGQCGVGNTTSPLATWTTVIQPPGSSNASAGLATVAVAGTSHTAVRKADGTVWVFGSNTMGQLGSGAAVTGYLVPTQLLMSYAVYTAYSVAAGANHTVILLNNDAQQAQKNRIVASGDNTFGQVGTPLPGIKTAFTPLPISDGAMIYNKTLGRGLMSTGCAYVDTDGTVYIWGSNAYGQIGDGTTVCRTVPGAMSAFNFVSGSTRIIGIAVGMGFAAAFDSNGALYTWGDNSAGQLGCNTGVNSPIPQNVSNFGSLPGRVVVAVSAGASHIIALDSGGAVHAWGFNSRGQVGNGTTNGSSVPTLVSGYGSLQGKTVISVATGYQASSATDSTGALHVWGCASDLGYSGPDVLLPVLSASGSLSGVTVLSASQGYAHGSALDSAGGVHVWGWNIAGQLGDGTNTDRRPPVLISNVAGSSISGRSIVSVVCGDMHTLALDSTGNVHAWGQNGQGQVGNNSAGDQWTPVNISSSGSLLGKTVISVAASCAHSMAMDSTGGIHVWGRGAEGQNGNNSSVETRVPILQSCNTRSVNAPMFSHGGLGDTKLLRGRNTDLSILQSVGANTYGQVGDGTRTTRPNVVSLPPLPAPVATCGSGLHHCGATLTDGTAYLWGRNNLGQCSGSSQNNVLTPTAVPSIANAASVCCGSNCSFLTLADGSVMALGDNTGNQLGLANGWPLAASSPVPVLDFDARSIQLQDGAAVNTWSNAGSMGAQMQATSSSSDPNHLPTLGRSGSLQHVVLDRTYSQYFSIAAPIAMTWLSQGGTYAGLTLFIVSQYSTAPAGNERLVDFGSGPTADNVIVYRGGNGTTTNLYMLDPIGGSAGKCDVPCDYTTFHTYIINVANAASGGTVSIYVDSPTNLVSSTSSQPVQTNRTTTHNYIGRPNDSSQIYLSANIRKITMFDHSLSPSEMKTVMSTMPVTMSVLSTGTPAAVSGLTNVVQLASGGGSSLALNSAGDVYSWGTNSWGATGQGTLLGSTAVPTLVNPAAWNSLKVTRIAAGDGVSALVTANGACYTCGVNTEGALGLPTNFGTGCVSTFSKVSDPNSSFSTGFGNAVVDVRCGARHTVLQLANNTVRVFGADKGGQVTGVNGPNQWQALAPPVKIATPVVAISASANSTLQEFVDRTTSAIGGGFSYTTKLMSGGSAFCASWIITPPGVVHGWGFGMPPVPVSYATIGSLNGAFIICISAGWEWQTNTAWVLALDNTGSVHAWGNNTYGQLGNGNNSGSSPVIISNVVGSSLVGVTTVQVKAGYEHSVALDSTGSLHTWGCGGYLGDGTTSNRSLPCQIMNIPGSSLVGVKITSVSVSCYHALAIDSTGSIHAWGQNNRGELGINSNTGIQNLPIMISNIQGGSIFGLRIVYVATGCEQSFAIDSTGQLHAWGQNDDGRLGTGDTNDRWVPVCISNNGSLVGKYVVAIACGGGSTAALDSTGRVHSWGRNSSGELGDGSNNQQNAPISPMTGAMQGKVIIAIAAGDSHYIALDTFGKLITWGRNDFGQVGNNSTNNVAVPQLISGYYGSLSSLDTTAPTAVSFTPFFVNFTGQHRVFVAGQSLSSLGQTEGFIVVCDQNDYITARGSAPAGKFSRGQNGITMNDTLPIVSLSKAAYDERVFGVLSSSVFPFYPGMDRSEQLARRLVEVGDIRMEVNALGAGAIWVCDSTGPLVSGNLVCSSGVPGYGMRQADVMPKVFQAFTVAKVTCDCDFTAPQQPVYQIEVDADGLNVLDGNGLPLWVACTTTRLVDSTGAVVTVQQQQQMTPEQQQSLTSSRVPLMEAKYRMRWLEADGTLITEAQYDAAIAASPSSPPSVFRAAFIGCTYHCG